MSAAMLAANGHSRTHADPETRLAYADEADFEELRTLRARVFADELGIQCPDYQDIFNDYFSKNVVLRRGSRISGAVRLAYSQETHCFYISYLVLDRRYRNRAQAARLLGAILHLMRENGIGVVCGHTTNANLAMYLSIGCTVTGPQFRKYGFRCDWTPIEYRLGTNGPVEDRLVARARRFLSNADTQWAFTSRVVVCPTLRIYQEVIRKLITTRRIFGTIAHLGQCLPEFRTPAYIRRIEVLGPGHIQQGVGDGFSYYNARVNHERVMMARRGSPFAAFAHMYGVLSNRRTVLVDNWTALRLHGIVRNIRLLVQSSEADAACAALAAYAPDSSVEVSAADDPEEMSTALLRDYLFSLGPVAANSV